MPQTYTHAKSLSHRGRLQLRAKVIPPMEVAFGRGIFASHVGVIATRVDLSACVGRRYITVAGVCTRASTHQRLPVGVCGETSIGLALQGCHLYQSLPSQHDSLNVIVLTQVPSLILCGTMRLRLHRPDVAVLN